MQIIKYIMLFLLFLSSLLLGKMLSKKYVERVEELEDIKNALNIFKTKIKFTYSPISEIFEEISKNASKKNTANLFIKSKEKMQNLSASEAWEEALKESSPNMNIKEEDLQKLKTLSKLLRNIRRRRTNKSNRINRRTITIPNKTSNTRKTKKRKTLPKTRSNNRTRASYNTNIKNQKKGKS